MKKVLLSFLITINPALLFSETYLFQKKIIGGIECIDIDARFISGAFFNSIENKKTLPSYSLDHFNEFEIREEIEKYKQFRANYKSYTFHLTSYGFSDVIYDFDKGCFQISAINFRPGFSYSDSFSIISKDKEKDISWARSWWDAKFEKNVCLPIEKSKAKEAKSSAKWDILIKISQVHTTKKPVWPEYEPSYYFKSIKLQAVAWIVRDSEGNILHKYNFEEEVSK